MLGAAHTRRGSAGHAAGRDELWRLEPFAAGFALIAAGPGIAAIGTIPVDVAVGQKTGTGLAMKLILGFGNDVAFFHEPKKEIAGDAVMQGEGSLGEVIETDTES